MPRLMVWKGLACLISRFLLTTCITPRRCKGKLIEVNWFRVKQNYVNLIIVLHRSLPSLIWEDHELQDHGVPVSPATRHLDLLEHPERVGGKHSSTFSWFGTPISVRVVTLCEHYEEAEQAGVGERQRRQRRADGLHRRLAAREPLFGFARELLRWMVDEEAPAAAPPASCGSIRVAVRDRAAPPAGPLYRSY